MVFAVACGGLERRAVELQPQIEAVIDRCMSKYTEVTGHGFFDDKFSGRDRFFKDMSGTDSVIAYTIGDRFLLHFTYGWYSEFDEPKDNPRVYLFCSGLLPQKKIYYLSRPPHFFEPFVMEQKGFTDIFFNTDMLEIWYKREGDEFVYMASREWNEKEEKHKEEIEIKEFREKCKKNKEDCILTVQ